MRPREGEIVRALAVGLAVLLAGCSARQEPAGPRAVPTPANKLGVHLLLDDGRTHWPADRWAEHMAYAREIVGPGGYVVQLVRSDDLDPAKWQVFMDLCAELGLTPVLRLATVYNRAAEQWEAPPEDRNGHYQGAARAYAEFISALVWPGELHLIIVGNEPNHGSEWGGLPDPAGYARYLIDSADALHAADPGARVLNAALDLYAPHTNNLPFIDGALYMDAESFMDGMYAAQPDVFTRIDVWNSHAYPRGPFSAPPWDQAYGFNLLNGATATAALDPPVGAANQGINGYRWELAKLASYGIRGLPVLISETGWRHSESMDPQALDGGPGLPDTAALAGYIDLALRGNGGRYPDLPEEGWTPWLEDPDVIGVVFFALDGSPAEWGHSNWLALDRDGEIEGVYAFARSLADAEQP